MGNVTVRIDYQQKDVDRFHAFYTPVTESGCWLWLGTCYWYGHGKMKLHGRMISVHRFSYLLHKGDPTGKQVLHKCDVPSCVNPDHLYLGDHKRNMRDRNQRGRSRGAPNLSPEKALTIYRKAHNGSSAQDLAREFGVTVETVRHIRNGRRWSSITGHKRTRHYEHD